MIKLDILDRINALLGEKEQQELTEHLKLNKTTYTDWKSGKSKSYRKYLIEIAEFFNVSIDYLVYGKEKSSSTELTEDERELLKYFKQLSNHEQTKLIGRAELLAEQEKATHIVVTRNKEPRRYLDIAVVAAGAGISTPFTEDDAFIKQSFRKSDIPDNADCGIPISGDSMEPEYPDGCIAWVSRTAPVKRGDVVIAIYNGEPLCKIYQPDGLYSFNPNYSPRIAADDDRIEIFGKVIGYYEEI